MSRGASVSTFDHLSVTTRSPSQRVNHLQHGPLPGLRKKRPSQPCRSREDNDNYDWQDPYDGADRWSEMRRTHVMSRAHSGLGRFIRPAYLNSPAVRGQAAYKLFDEGHILII